MKCFNTSVNIKKNYTVIRYSGALLFTARYYSLSPFLEIFFSSLVHQLALQLISRPNGVLLVSKKSLSPRSPWIRPRCLPRASFRRPLRGNECCKFYVPFFSLSFSLSFFFLPFQEGRGGTPIGEFSYGIFSQGRGRKKTFS